MRLQKLFKHYRLTSKTTDMKKIILVLVASICSFQVWSQGTLELTAGAAIKTTGSAYLVLENMHIKNNGSFQQTSENGIVKLTGGLNVNLSGNSATVMNELLMAKSGNALNLLRNLSIVSDVTFSGGLLNLNNNILDLANTGSFIGESEVSRAFTTGTGYIQATGILNNPSGANLGNLGAAITSNTNLGNTTIKRGHKVQTGISGSNNSIMRYFDIIPANNRALKAMLRFYYFDAELNSLPEATLNHWQSPNLINWNLMGADTRDGIANYVERKTYGKFDRITLATATAPGIICQPNQTVSANSKGCKALVSLAATATGIPDPSISYKIGNTVITSPYLFSKGTTTVTATAANGIVPNASCTFTVTVVCGPVPSSARLGEPQQETIIGELSVSARPNPSANYFTLDIKSNDRHPVTIKVIDVMGRVISTQPDVASNTSLKVGHKYRPGIYFVQAIQGKQIVTLKLVKQAY
jgi:hypothetical protein